MILVGPEFDRTGAEKHDPFFEGQFEPGNTSGSWIIDTIAAEHQEMCFRNDRRGTPLRRRKGKKELLAPCVDSVKEAASE